MNNQTICAVCSNPKSAHIKDFCPIYMYPKTTRQFYVKNALTKFCLSTENFVFITLERMLYKTGDIDLCRSMKKQAKESGFV